MTVKAITAAHAETKGDIGVVTSEVGSDSSEARVYFCEVDPKAKDVRVCAMAATLPAAETIRHALPTHARCPSLALPTLTWLHLMWVLKHACLFLLHADGTWRLPGMQVVAFNLDSYAKYNMESSLSVGGLKAFAQGLVAGTVKPHYKSEEACVSWPSPL